MAESRSRSPLVEILAQLVDDAPTVANVGSTMLMLIMCGMTLGYIGPELAQGQFGPSLTAFFTAMGTNFFGEAISRVRARRDKGERLTHEDVQMFVALVQQAQLEDRLRDEALSRELRTKFAKLGVLEDLIASVPEATAAIVIEALNTKTDLLAEKVVTPICDLVDQQFAALSDQIAALAAQVGPRARSRAGAPTGRHVFISYARADGEDLARRLHNDLEADGIEAWLDRYDIKPGDDWDATIQAAIEDCRAFVFVVTPGSVASTVCKNEWKHAQSTHKHIILVIAGDATIPLVLNHLQGIDFRKRDFRQGMAQLRQALTVGDDPFHVPPEKAAEQERRAEVLIEADARARQQRDRGQRPRWINGLPQDVRDRFHNRAAEQARIVNYLKSGARLISIYGRGGVGKTALACKVLGDLEHAADGLRPDGMVYLSGTRSGDDLRLDRILSDFARLLDGDALTRLEAAIKDPALSAAAKTHALLDALHDGDYVLLLDNFEPLQNDKTLAIKDDDLRAFVETVLERGGLGLLLTSRYPVALANDHRAYELREPLDKGLPRKHAIAFLRNLDADGVAGLRDAPQVDLIFIAKRTRGFPRALEAVRGWLLNDNLRSLKDLLADPALLGKEVTPVIVQQAIVRLQPYDQRVLEALALYNRPVGLAALEYLLAPYLDTSTLRDALNRLVGAGFAAYNRARETFALHPIDKEFLIGRIPEGTQEDAPPLDDFAHIFRSYAAQQVTQPPADTSPTYSRFALNARAADYFARQKKPEADWKTIDDLAPQLAEFDYRVGAGDYDTAAQLLLGFGFDYLLLWGHYRLMIELHERLQVHIRSSSLARRSVGNLGTAYQNVGRIQDAIACYERALALARQDAERQAEGAWLGNLGTCYSALGQIEKAFDYYQQALAIRREIGDRRGEGSDLTGLGTCYSDLGQIEKAIDYHQQALAISREIGDRRGEDSDLTGLGTCYSGLGQIEKAIDYYQQALAISREIGYRSGEGADLGSLGTCYSDLGQIEKAIDYYQQALAIRREIGDRPGEGIDLNNIGSMFHELGEFIPAIQHFEQALTIAREIGDRNGEVIRLDNFGNCLGLIGQHTKAVSQIREALELADTIGSPRLQNGVRCNLVEVLLVTDDLPAARAAIEPAHVFDVVEFNHLAAALQGIVLARVGEATPAGTVFAVAVAYADKILALTPDYYAALYTRALARAGQALLDGRELTPAIADYQAARAVCAAKGVLIIQTRRLDLLMACPGGERLAPIRTVLTGT